MLKYIIISIVVLLLVGVGIGLLFIIPSTNNSNNSNNSDIKNNSEIERDKLQLAANCTFEPDAAPPALPNTVCSVCEKGYLFMDGPRTKCCPKIDGCPSGWYGKQNATSEDCGCGKCLQDHIPNCNTYNTACECTDCDSHIPNCNTYNMECECTACDSKHLLANGNCQIPIMPFNI